MTADVARYADNWIESFLEYTQHISSPRIFRKWTAVSILCAVMERRCWVKTTSRVLYPNMYTLLVGPPGVGKTEAIKSVYELTYDLKDFVLAPDDVSSASLMDALKEADCKRLRPTETPPFIQYNAMMLASDELGVFLKQYEGAFMSKLNKLFDNTPYKEKKRGSNLEIIIERPVFNFLAGTTPAWLGSNLPVSAWAEGFASRLIMIYSGERIKADPFAETVASTVQLEKLFQDLQQVFNTYGQFVWMEDVAGAFKAWYFKDMDPAPEHPRLESYVPRRNIHFMKLLMACSIARSSEMIIRMEDYQYAQDMLLEAEHAMPDVFKSMSMSSDSSILDETFSFIYTTWAREGQKPVKQHRIVNFIRERAPVHAVMKVLETMVSSRLIRISEMGTDSNHGYTPIPRSEHGR